MKKVLLLILCVVAMGYAFCQNTHWTPMSGFSDNMDVIATVYIDEVEQFSETLELGAFCGDECRGAALPLEEDGHWLYFLLISANQNGDEITYRLYDHSISQELDLNCNTVLLFVANDDIEPYYVYFTTPTPPAPASWDDPSIWGGTVPGPESSVTLPGDVVIGEGEPETVTVAGLTIPDGVSLTVEEGSTLIVTGDLVNNDEDGLVIENGAQVINESAGVKATAHKDIQAWTSKDSNGWHLIASPIDGMAVAGSDFVTETYDLYRYDEPTYTWENYRTHYNTDFLTFEKGRGYLYANSNTGFSPAFTGDLNYAAVSYAVSFDSPGPLKGFNLIGNPFPHNIYKGAGGAIDDSKLASGYYTLSYNGEWVAHTFEDVIAPEQGILVKTTASGNITISKTNAESTAETSTKDIATRLKINVSGNGRSDRAYAYFGEGIGLDKMAHYSSSAAQIAIREGENDYAIAHVGADCEEMNVVFKNTKNGYYTVTFEGLDDFEYLHLIDNILGIETDMKQEPYYKFHALGNENENRFKIVLRDYSGIDDNTDNQMFAYIAGGNIIVKGEGTLQIIDMTGRIVNTINVNGVENIEKPTQDGIYVLRIINGNNVKNQKIVVR